ncbi:Serine/threonine-protein kinase grp [Lucilia cuprina]|nr:Serine/threonine-protein kinase grp [Lucilia cuprina]
MTIVVPALGSCRQNPKRHFESSVVKPDIGMPQHEAQRYFTQLLSGLQYLHQRGIAHRDLKPENLLLDEHDNIKISDFGMATMFRCKGKERLLDKRCGTLPYVAPEVLLKPYHAQPADIWSCGVILVTMLAGVSCYWYIVKESQFIFERPKQFQLPSIPENNMIAVFAAMLAERRIILTSKRLDRLSSAIQAANAFLYPMLKDYLSAPMPYLIVPLMIAILCLPKLCAFKKRIKSAPMKHMGDRVSKIFLGVLVQLFGGYRDAHKFIESRPSHLRPFLRKMMELQIFVNLIGRTFGNDEYRLGFSDESNRKLYVMRKNVKNMVRFYHSRKELPWDQPSIQCQEFINWKDNDRWSTQTPWSKLDTLAISLLRKVLATNPTYRLSLDKILDHKWCNMQFIDSDRSRDLVDSAAALEILK